jgi:hypothetical protein
MMKKHTLHRLISTATLFVLATSAPAQGLRDVIPRNQKPLLNVFPPSIAEQAKPGIGKFVIFTREQVGKEWDAIAGAWECIPSRPEIPIAKRVKFCHSSWNCTPLLNVLVADDSAGMHPRFVRLQVNSGDTDYSVNIYDINYRTWDVRCLWQGPQMLAFGVMNNSIFCGTPDGWRVIDARSGKLSNKVPFTPVETDGKYWLVRKANETNGCWSYDGTKRRYIANFGPVEEPALGFSRSKLSPNGKHRAWVVGAVGDDWRGGAIQAKLIFQRGRPKEDVLVPIVVWAVAGSGVPVIPVGLDLTFAGNEFLEVRTQQRLDDPEDHVWSIDIATGKVNRRVARVAAPAVDAHAVISGVPVREYLRKYHAWFTHEGPDGLAPAFMAHLGILPEQEDYPSCKAGVSRDGRHVLYRATKGALSNVYIYGDLDTRRTVRFIAPEGLRLSDSQEFVWVETPR